MRSIDPILADGLANQKGSPILRVNTWNDKEDYNATPNTPRHTWQATDFDIFSTSAKARIVTANDYTISAFTIFIIEQGLKIDGVEYTIESGLYFIRDYKEDYGFIEITGSSYPNQKISIAGDQTYQAVIEAFCAAIGKTASFRNPNDNWLSFQFLPAGKLVILNKAEAFENMLRQKYTILVYENEPGILVFYTQSSYTTDMNWNRIAWSPELGIFCAVAQAGAGIDGIITSPDGINWTQRDAPADNSWFSVTWSPELGLFCAVANTGTDRVMTSPDGINWTLRTAAEANPWLSICWSPELGLFCATSQTGTNQVMTSPDGINWTSRTSPANVWISVTWSPELTLFCAVAQSGSNTVMTSPDGINWTSRTAFNASNQIVWSPELGIFCATSQGNGSNQIKTSPDGINWTSRTVNLISTLNSITWSPELGIFVALTSFPTSIGIAVSNNGIDWSPAQGPQGSWYGVTWSPELGIFCAVGNSGQGTRCMTSPDGTNWTLRSTAAAFALTYLDGPKSHIIRSQSEVHYFWKDAAEQLLTYGDTTKPQWNLGFLDSDDPPTIKQDPYYKIFLQKAPIRLDITDSDKIQFTPYWSIDPTQTIDAMMQISTHFHVDKAIPWYQEIRSIVMFDSTEGGALPSTIERVSNYTPLNTSAFDGVLSSTDNNLQAAMNTIDDHVHAATSTYTDESIQDLIGAMFTGNTETGITVTYQDTDGTIDLEVTGGGGREVLTAARTYYVRTDGSDVNNGLADSAGGAFLTIQKAIDVTAMLDMSIYDVTIQVRSGTYSTSTGNICKQCIGAGQVIILGDETTPGNVIVKLTAALSYSGGCFFGSSISTIYNIRGIQFKTDATGNYAINANSGAFIKFQKCDFNAGTQNFLGHLRADLNATIQATGNYTVSASVNYHILCAFSGCVRAAGITVTLTGTPAWAGTFVYGVGTGLVIYDTVTFSGAATGKRYQSDYNAVIWTAGGGVNYFPGNVAGTTSTGGQYV